MLEKSGAQSVEIGTNFIKINEEAKLAGMLNDANIDQVLALDSKLRIIAWNKACETVSGIPKSRALGASFIELRPEVAGFPAIMEAIGMAWKGYKSFVPWEKGSYGGGYFENHFIPLRGDDDKGTLVGVLNIIHDVSHRIKAEKELESLNRALALKNKELKIKSEELANFNYIASHDLKEPLRKIYTFIEMVASKEGQKISDAARSNLRRAQSAVQRLGLLTDDIVTFSEVTVPHEQLSEVNLADIQASAEQQLQRVVEDSGAVVTSTGLPMIIGYFEMLRHLWAQMLGNALKFHGEGAQPKVAVSYSRIPGPDISVADADADSEYHCITFDDNGIGFEMIYAEKIFGMFQRLHEPGTYKGTGMGLSICRRIAEAHQGFITVESVVGKGSRFSCYLKVMDASDALPS